MLESILQPGIARNNPLEVMILSIILGFVAVLFSYHMFPEYSSVLSCAFITILFAPFFQRLFASEEAMEEFAMKHHMDKNLFQRHAPVIKIYSAYFMGLIILMSLMFVFMPSDMKSFVFQKQMSEVERLSGIQISGAYLSPTDAQRIFFNNMLVMVFAFISSLVFGSGAAFILSWNASVIGVYVGVYVKQLIGSGMFYIFAYAYGMPYALLSITLHGVPEIFGYFFAGMAGGILSVGLLREKLYSKEMNVIFVDSILFMLFGAFSIFVGAFVEVGNPTFGIATFIAYMVFIAALIFHSRS